MPIADPTIFWMFLIGLGVIALRLSRPTDHAHMRRPEPLEVADRSRPIVDRR